MPNPSKDFDMEHLRSETRQVRGAEPTLALASRSACQVPVRDGLSRRAALAGGVALAWLRARPVRAEPGTLAEELPATSSITIERQATQLLPAPAKPAERIVLSLSPPAEAIRLRAGVTHMVHLRNALPAEPDGSEVTLYFRGLQGQIDGANQNSLRLKAGEERAVTLLADKGGTALITALPAAPALSEQGLALPLIVAEHIHAEIDSESVLLLKDFRLQPDGTLAAASGARLGNALSVNGRLEQQAIPLRRHERHRLRLINASTARIVVLQAFGFMPLVMALDGAPCEVFEPAEGRIVLPPGGRADILIELSAPPAEPPRLTTRIGPVEFDVMGIVYLDDAPLRQKALAPFASLASEKPGARLDLAKAQRVPLSIRQAEWVREAERGGDAPALFSAMRGRTIVLEVDNIASVPAVFHLEGHRVRPLDGLDDGVKPWVLDTVLLPPDGHALLAFIAERPGRYRLHWRELSPPFVGYASSFVVTA